MIPAVRCFTAYGRYFTVFIRKIVMLQHNFAPDLTKSTKKCSILEHSLEAVHILL